MADVLGAVFCPFAANATTFSIFPTQSVIGLYCCYRLDDYLNT
jgi:hypothetical protein